MTMPKLPLRTPRIRHHAEQILVPIMLGERHSFLPATLDPPHVYLTMPLGHNYAQVRASIQVDDRSMDLIELQSNLGSYEG
jgi:hypothetical protein